MSSRKGGQYSTTIREEVKAELQISAKATPEPERPPVEAACHPLPFPRFGRPS